jgi:hypothetical protein
MRGKFLHNNVLVGPIVLELSRLGYQVFVEHPIRPGQRPPCVDMFIIVGDKRIVIEVECSPTRIANDIAKAREFTADLLLVVIPHARLQARVRAALKRLLGHGDHIAPQVQVLTLGATLCWVASNCPPVTAPLVADGIANTNQTPD